MRHILCYVMLLTFTVSSFADDHPLKKEDRDAIKQNLDEAIKSMSERIDEDEENVQLYSRRGDAHFFRGNFDEAVADYEKMVDLKKSLDSSHWRRGIAFFYAKKFKKAAHQFEIYHSFDDVDRENGIWRYLSQSQAYGIPKAREGLLKYKKDDREPFPDVYQLFAGKITADEILKKIEAAKVDDQEREKRLFYAHLYVGLNYFVEKKPSLAEKHLRLSTSNKWGPRAGFGPNYMWHVGRVHYDLLVAARTKVEEKKTK